MKIISVELQHFASYDFLNFKYSDQGLTLIQGPTGSGKSTLMDAVPWVLFGRTAKGGAVDEIRAWTAGSAVTSGVIALETNGKIITIKRTRGSAKDNDLVYMLDDNIIRGKDLKDTQSQINKLLGIDCDLYLAGAYYHEFSQTAQFFNATAKDRRTLCEQIVDLTLAKTLQQAVSTDLKVAAGLLQANATEINTTQTELDAYVKMFQSEAKKEQLWTVQYKKNREARDTNHQEFEDNRYEQMNALRKEIKQNQELIKSDAYFIANTEATNAKIAEAKEHNKCEHCGASKSGAVLEIFQAALYDLKIEQRDSDKAKTQVSALTKRLETLKKTPNPYEVELNAVNPHTSTLDELSAKIEANKEYLTTLKVQESNLSLQKSDIELLVEVIAEYRSLSVKNTIEYIQNQTNQLLSEHFDAEIKVSFSVVDADKLDVIITKDGNTCVYSQLSKGQRQLLKLCFSVAVMRQVSNHHGVKFEQVFFDEALDGTDDIVKNKAFYMFNALSTEYNSVFIIEHSSEFKAMVNNSYLVALINGHSQIEES